MFVCIHYNRNATQNKKYVDMNIFGILYKMYIAKISLSFIMEADTKIFLILLQFITTTFTIYNACLYCILCYQFISDSTSKFFIFTSKCS